MKIADEKSHAEMIKDFKRESMKVRDLIDKLEKIDPEFEVYVWDPDEDWQTNEIYMETDAVLRKIFIISR